jgi:hypothetical protein
MGNIHLIPTDNEQHSIVQKNTGLLLIQTPSKEYGGIKLNIHITNSEQINEGDWTVWKNQLFKVDSNNAYSYTNNVTLAYAIKYLKKIILTTDADLIKDGVQAIDDEFLEWFVKNPSCEEVEVQKWFDGLDFLEYKIIIPQEEPNLENLESISSTELSPEFQQLVNDNWDYLIGDELKQETLEEAAKEGYNNMPFGIGLIKRRSVFLLGAKWQAERMYKRMYSEEEVLELVLSRPGPYLTDEEIKEWFEQFKKK